MLIGGFGGPLDMAMSKCGSCGQHRFELREGEPSGSRFKFNLVQCSSCGVPVGAVEYEYIGALIEGIEQRLTDIENRLP